MGAPINGVGGAERKVAEVDVGISVEKQVVFVIRGQWGEQGEQVILRLSRREAVTLARMLGEITGDRSQAPAGLKLRD
jgi:predicted KAP-like P-loop ATPase